MCNHASESTPIATDVDPEEEFARTGLYPVIEYTDGSELDPNSGIITRADGSQMIT